MRVTKEPCREGGVGGVGGSSDGGSEGVVTNYPGQELAGRSVSFLRLTSCRETRRICRERFREHGRYLVTETTLSYDGRCTVQVYLHRGK